MSYSIFISWFLLFVISFKSTHNSLLSRFRNPNEYVPRDAGKLLLPEDIDDTLYEELLLEVPELRGQLRRSENGTLYEYSMLPYLKSSKNYSYEIAPNEEEFDTDKDNDQEEYPSQLDYITITQKSTDATTHKRKLPFLTRSPPTAEVGNRGQNLTPERFFWKSPWFSRKKVTSCFWCGLNHATKLPLSSLCYDAFESPDWRARTMARFFRARCFFSNSYSEHIETFRYSKWTTYRWDRGLVRAQYGPFHGGCFKRFLDVGKIYTQRGCRSWWPKYSSTASFVTHRFTRLEALLRWKKDYCIVSPHASLTPFSRAISLYVRYHVCVCSKRYCNGTEHLEYTLSLIFGLLIYLALYLFVFFGTLHKPDR